MATAREHLQDLHKGLAKHHVTKSAFHKKMAAHCENLAGHLGKAESDAKETLAAMAAEHGGMADEHAAMALTHTDAAEACAKAAAAELNKLVPDGVSRVAPSIPESALRPGITAIPRAGSAPIARPVVPSDFEKVFSVEEPE